MMRKFTIALISLFFSIPAFACNPGQGTGQCGHYDSNGIYHNTPIGSGNSTYSTPEYSAPRNVVIRLSSRYGAVASSGNSTLGISFNEKSSRKAKQEALSRCKEIGGINCKIIFEQRNACFSIAEGYSKQTLYGIRFGYSDNKYESENLALNKCRSDGLSGCKIISSEECSLPVP